MAPLTHIFVLNFISTIYYILNTEKLHIFVNLRLLLLLLLFYVFFFSLKTFSMDTYKLNKNIFVVKFIVIIKKRNNKNIKVTTYKNSPFACNQKSIKIYHYAKSIYQIRKQLKKKHFCELRSKDLFLKWNLLYPPCNNL